MEIDIYKHRSFKACMSDALEILTHHWRSALRKNWIAALVFSIFASITTIFHLPFLALRDWGIEYPLSSWIIQTIVYLGCFVSALFLVLSILRWVHQCKTRNIIRKIKHIGHYIVLGVRHFGGLLTILLLSSLIIACLMAIVALPAIVLSLSQIYAQIGAYLGDPVGLPNYFVGLMFVVFTITWFVFVIFATWEIVALYLYYGSAEKQEQEKIKLNHETN